MRIVREPFALLGIFFLAAGTLLTQYAQSKGVGALIPFGLLYAGAGAVMIALSLRPKRNR